MEHPVGILLLTGIDVVGLAYSAKKAGYKVFSFDYFGDADLRKVSDEWFTFKPEEGETSLRKFPSPFDSGEFLDRLETMKGDESIKGVLLSSGFDDDFPTLLKLDNQFGIIGNTPNVIRNVRDKNTFFKELDKLGILHPQSMFVNDFEECRRFVDKSGYPIVLKPSQGFGGYGVRKTNNWENLETIFNSMKQSSNTVLLQSFVKGSHCSASFISTEKGGTLLSINEQLLGLSEVHQEEPFGYCGNTVPMETSEEVTEKITEMVDIVSKHYRLRGSNGIDLVITPDGEPFLIEVNPRFQGTLECVEKYSNINLVETHVKACLIGVAPVIKTSTDGFFTRLILYSPKKTKAPNLTSYEGLRDIPLPGATIEKGEPLCSVLTEGNSRKESYENALLEAEKIYARLN